MYLNLTLNCSFIKIIAVKVGVLLKLTFEKYKIGGRFQALAIQLEELSSSEVLYNSLKNVVG